MLTLMLTLALGTSLTLEGSTDTLELQTSSTASLDYQVSWSNVTATALTTPGTSVGNVAAATTTTIVAAPAASNWRHIRGMNFRNANAIANTIIVQVDRSAANRTFYRTTLAANESATWEEQGGWRVYAANGVEKRQSTELQGYNGLPLSWIQKVGTASEAAAIRYAYAKDTGTPGAWAPGTPGLNGSATNCDAASTAAIAGSPVIPDPASGFWYLTYGAVSSSGAHSFEVYDLLWFNTGLVVTTTTEQAITTPTLPARDATGTNDGQGWMAAIYVTIATTNAGAVTNMTLNYTDQSGNPSATATMASFPITAVAGTLVPFQLAAGDTGIRSIQGITLGTSLITGTISLVLLRPIYRVPVVVANIGSPLIPPSNPGIRLYNDTCLWLAYMSSVTTAATTSADLWIMER